MPPPRSNKTCGQCRSRKVKCNSTAGHQTCENCSRLGFICSFTESPLVSVIGSPPERRRGPPACIQCRLRKTRCSGDLPLCSGCQKLGRECVYPELSRGRPVTRGRQTNKAADMSPASHQPSPGMAASPGRREPVGHDIIATPEMVTAQAHAENTNSTPEYSWNRPQSSHGESTVAGGHLQLPPVREQLQLVIDFFRHVYPVTSYSFLNDVSVTQRCLDRTIDQALLLSLCAVSAQKLRYPKYHPGFTSSWIKHAEDIVWSHISQPNFFRTQAMLLIVNYHIDSGDFQRAFMLSSIVARGATALRLQYERTDLGPVAQEIRRRLMWCIVVIDGHFSIGLPECEMAPFEAIYLFLPCNEEDFNADQEPPTMSSASVPLDGVPEAGLLSINIRQQVVRRDLVRLRRQLSLSNQPVPHLETTVTQFSDALSSMDIPPYSTSELQRYAKSRWLVRYVCVQISWRQCWLDLYRHFLPGYPESAPRSITAAFSASYMEDAARKCVHYALSNIHILQDLKSMSSDLLVPDIDMAICGYHAARLVMFLSRSFPKVAEPDVTPEAATSMTTSMVDILTSLFPYSRLVGKLCTSLQTILPLHIAGHSESSHAYSDLDDDEREGSVPRFALAAKNHQSLGVHSILRQARFVDDSYKVGGEFNRMRSAGPSSLNVPPTESGPQTSLISGQPHLGAISNEASTPVLTTELGNVHSAISVELGQPVAPTYPSLNPFSAETTDHWSDLYLPPDFYTTSDGDFF